MAINWEPTQTITSEKLNNMQKLNNFEYTYNSSSQEFNGEKNLEEWLYLLINNVEFLKDVIVKKTNFSVGENQEDVILKKSDIKAFENSEDPATYNYGAADYQSFKAKIDYVSGQINSNIRNAIQKIYPIGTVIIRTDDNDISTSLSDYGVYFIPFGAGRFLLGADNTLGETGGESSVTLQTSNIPKITKTFSNPNFSISQTKKKVYTKGTNANAVSNVSLTKKTNSTSITIGQNNPTAFNILPPYIKVKFWKSVSQSDYNIFNSNSSNQQQSESEN